MKLWAASVGWVFCVVRAETAEEAQAIAEAKAEEVGCTEIPSKAWELSAEGAKGLVAEVIS